ncbi:MAG: ParB N-terminal domain-containing protein [Firmicutes bacterium]|nr:ParB N-terminal domain-containing protein [Bacillota bacterium]
MSGREKCLFRFRLLRLCGLKAHEHVDQRHLLELADEIRRDGELRQPVLVDERSMVILDGHHRVAALKRLGCLLVPSYLVDYSDDQITVWPRRPDIPITKQNVVRMGLNGTLYPPKTSRHEWPLIPPPAPVPLERLGRDPRALRGSSAGP